MVDSMRHDGYLVGILLSSIREISALMGGNDAQEVSKQAFRDYVTTSDKLQVITRTLVSISECPNQFRNRSCHRQVYVRL
jgi:hypothetical protein